MATKRELVERIAELEEELESIQNRIGDLLGTEGDEAEEDKPEPEAEE